MCIQLYVLHNTNTFRHEKCGGTADINFTPFQHPNHSAPRTILSAISPVACDFETYPKAKVWNFESINVIYPNKHRMLYNIYINIKYVYIYYIYGRSEHYESL